MSRNRTPREVPAFFGSLEQPTTPRSTKRAPSARKRAQKPAKGKKGRSR